MANSQAENKTGGFMINSFLPLGNNKKTATQPIFTKPFGGTTTQPFGTTQNPFGGTTTTTQPFGTTQTPFGGTTGTTQYPFGGTTSTQPFGKTTPFGGTTTQPLGSSTQPFGTTTTQSPFGGTTTQPFGTTQSPFTTGTTTTQSPFGGTTTQPLGSSTQPFGTTTTQSPFGGTTTQPFGTTQSPFTTGTTIQSPFGGTQPFGTTQAPFGGTTTQPFGTTQSPFTTGTTTTQSPFGETTTQPGTTTQPFGTQPPIFGTTQPQSTPLIQKSQLYDFLYTDRYNKDHVEQKGDEISINLGQIGVLHFEVIDKIAEDTYRLKDKKNNIGIAIRFATVKSCFTEGDLNNLKIRSVGKKLFNKDKNRLEPCYFTEQYDGTLRKYLSLREKDDSSPWDKFAKLRVAEDIRKHMTSLYEWNNRFVYTDISLDSVIYRYASERESLDNVEFGLVMGDFPYDSEDQVYLTSYPPIEIQTGELSLKTNEDKLTVLSWQLGVLLLLLVTRNTVEFNKLHWLSNRSFGQAEYRMLIDTIKTEYGDRYTMYIHNFPNERPSISLSLL